MHLGKLNIHRQAAAADQQNALQAQKLKIVDVNDISYKQVDKDKVVLHQEDILLQRSTKLRRQLLLATCAVFAQKLLHESSYTSPRPT